MGELIWVQCKRLQQPLHTKIIDTEQLPTFSFARIIYNVWPIEVDSMFLGDYEKKMSIQTT